MQVAGSGCNLARRSEIPEEMELLQGQIERAHDYYIHLSDRLNSIMSQNTIPPGREDAKTGASPNPTTELGGCIRRGRLSLTNTLDCIQDIIERLEL